MRGLMLGLTALAFAGGPASAAMVAEKVPYSVGGTDFEGILVYDDDIQARRPAVLMAPNWMGVTDNAVTKARKLAGQDYAIFIADMYGVGVRPQNSSEAGKAAGAVRADLEMQRARINKALDVLLEEGGRRGVIDPDRTAAIGFCFGGGNVLELARSGRDVNAVVSFHGSLTTPRPEDAKNIEASVLVLHGADDPAAPKADRDALEAELTAADVDWQMVVFSNTVHSFTNPEADSPGRSQYNERSARRAFEMMYDLFDEVL